MEMKWLIVFVFCCYGYAHGHPPIQRIVNGTDAAPGQYPYIVGLQYGLTLECGSSIIGKKWLLTAAHCIFQDLAYAAVAVYGTVKSYDMNFPPPENTVKVKRFIVHPEYNASDHWRNDVALVELAKPLMYNKNVRPIPLADSSSPAPEGHTAVLVGWGYPYTGGSTMKTLQQADLPVWTNENCTKALPAVDPSVQVCAGDLVGGKGQCSGDSGGPLALDGVQIGVVSWSVKPCGIEGYPGVFARVSTYREWIRKESGI